MRLRFLFIPGALAFAALLLTARSPFLPLDPLLGLRGPTPSALPDPALFQQAALATANQTRASLSSPLPALAPHPLATAALEDFVQADLESPDHFDRLFASLQARRPQLHEMGSHLFTAASQDALLAALAEWPQLTKPGYTHLATAIFRQPGRAGASCLATVLRELPLLRLPVSRRVGFTACDTCRICQSSHGVTLSPQSQSILFIHCPHCKKPYDLLAADNSGYWRRANQFLEGFDRFTADPAVEPEERVLSIWKQLDERCRYQFDPERISGEDSWNLPGQTYELTWGDCEDTSMLLADALISNGIEARVVLGRQKGQGHAWCVVRLGARQHILESTAEGVANLRRLPRLDDLALDYHPDCQFDRKSLYFNRHGQWTADYWSVANWLQVNDSQDSQPTIASTPP